MIQNNDKNTNATSTQTKPAHDTAKWEQAKTSARKAWNKISDDDFNRAQESVDKLADIIHTKFGETKEAILAKLTGVQADRTRKPEEANGADHKSKPTSVRTS